MLADPTQVQQALMNLAANARDAMPDGGKLTIEVANWEMKQGCGEPADVPPGHYVTPTVSDTGAGMSPEIQSRAFDPFSRRNTSEKVRTWVCLQFMES